MLTLPLRIHNLLGARHFQYGDHPDLGSPAGQGIRLLQDILCRQCKDLLTLVIHRRGQDPSLQ